MAETFHRIKNERVCEECEAWFDASAFVVEQNVKPIIRIKRLA